jgi:murein DD-endopeptidase MepM/ murein hydrolase activator NlpD
MSRRLRLFAALTAFALASTALVEAAQGDATPWRARRRPGARASERASVLVDVSEWPAEPASPEAASIDAARFADALRQLCGGMPRDRPQRYAEWILSASREAGIDPFLLAGLVFRMSRCDPDADELGGVGLTLLPREMYAGALSHGVYRYRVRESSGAWATRETRVDRFPFAGPRLIRAEESLYFAAHLLAAWDAQHASVDAAFPQAPHRHFISHWIWGDRVQSARAEDRVLTDRRRMLRYYGALADTPPIERLGVTMGAPLDGSPRVVSSFPGSDRDEGARVHRGIDVEAATGEPVRAIADGRVSFAGCDMPGAQAAMELPPERVGEIPREALGPGGRFVCVVHRSTEAPLVSCYMHLEETSVRTGDRVTRGQQLGTVGRTGCRVSSPHLHLELRGERANHDASQVMAGMLLGHEPPDERRLRLRVQRRRARDAWLATRAADTTP